MPTVADPIRSICKLFCLALVPLFAACGGGGGGDGGGGGGSGPLAAACGGFTVTRTTPTAPAPGAPPAGISLSLTLIESGFVQPTFVAAPLSDNRFLFVLEKRGTIQVVERATNNVINLFLDIQTLVQSGNDERGLLGLAFDPNYANNRRFYVSYIDINDNLVVARYLTDPNNPTEAIPTEDGKIISIPNPLGNLFGGGLAFGPTDGMLYISRGHGGDNPGSNVGDPNNMAQNLGSLLGKMLRVNVNTDDFPADPDRNYGIPADNPCVGQAGALGEIWSIGLRNPWRFSFDRAGGNLYIADVGHTSREEVNVSTVAEGAGKGANYGWRIMEGKTCFDPASGCNPDRITQPAVDYSSEDPSLDCSVVGGYVYRGQDIPALAGTYFYGDFCSGAVRSFSYNAQVDQHAQWPFPNPGMITSFGEDAQGEIYITTIEGNLYRITTP
jgi:glucose/arabinose dehydrogenase